MSAIPTHSSNAYLASAAAQPTYRDFRDYDQPGIDRVRTFYRNNHQQQTYAFVAAKKARWLKFQERSMTP